MAFGEAVILEPKKLLDPPCGCGQPIRVHPMGAWHRRVYGRTLTMRPGDLVECMRCGSLSRIDDLDDLTEAIVLLDRHGWILPIRVAGIGRLEGAA